jgi:hypothetical protein
VTFEENIGVWYSDTEEKWAIFDQTWANAMPVGVKFNVKILGQPGDYPLSGSVTHESWIQSGNTSSNKTTITKSSAAGSGTIIIVTPNWNPNGSGGTYNNHVTGVSYSAWPSASWSIFNEDSATMPSAAAFNVWEPYPNL